MLGSEGQGVSAGQDLLEAVCPSKLQRLIETLLATLTDLEFDYEQERERIRLSTQDAALRIRVLERLKTRHYERREPYVKHLAILQEALMRQMHGG